MKNFVLSACLISVLVGCGGGGSDNNEPAKVAGNPSPAPVTPSPTTSEPIATVDSADKYVGTWKGDCQNNSAGSVQSSSRLTLVVEKKSASVLNYNQAASVFMVYASTDCSGAAIKTESALRSDIGDIEIAGTQVANGKEADKIIISYKNSTWKDLAYTSNGKLYFGATSADDAFTEDGYPVNLKLTAALTKQ